MDEISVLTATLNNTIARSAKIVQAYEVEIANLTAEIVRLQSQIEESANKSKQTTKSS
jgi:hypothetical protein